MVAYSRAVKTAEVTIGGFTTVELLVSLTVITLLLSLLLPAIQDARESSRRIHCQNSLKQLVLAVQNFESSHRYFPGGCGSPQPFDSRTTPGAISAHAVLLPHLEQAAEYQRLDFEETGVTWYPLPRNVWGNGQPISDIPMFRCPSAGLPAKANSYRFCVGAGRVLNQGGAMSCVCGLRRTGEPHIIRPRLVNISDGLSNTALASETFVGDGDDRAFTPRYDSVRVSEQLVDGFRTSDSDSIAQFCAQAQTDSVSAHVSNGGRTWVLSGNAYTWYSHILPPNSRVSDCTASGASMQVSTVTARSYHRLSVNLAMADGAVVSSSNSIDLKVWRDLGWANNGMD